jgi:tetratricopeptide (TPR) repeat protein
MKIQLTFILILSIFCSFGQTTGYEKTKTLYDQGKFKEAIEIGTIEIKTLKASDPDYMKIIRLRSDCFIELSNFKSAVEDFNTLIKLDSKNVPLYVAASYCYWELGDNANCFNYLEKAHQINPKDVGTLSNMAYYFGQGGKYDESIKYATLGLEQNPPNTLKGTLLNNRGYAYINLKQYDTAIKDINQSISFHPDNSYAYCYRALANIGLKKMDTVCNDLEKAKQLGGVTLTRDLIVKHCGK